jgi:hypothetical protein
MRHLLTAIAGALVLLGLPSTSRADQRTDTVPAVAPSPRTLPHPNQSLRAGARVSGVLTSGSRIQGTVLTPFTMDSQRIVLCAEPGQGCSTETDLGSISVPLSELRALSVRSDHRSGGAYLGLYGGALIGGLALGGFEEGNEHIAVGSGFLGLLIGGFIGSRIPGWQPIFPCAHGCAGGEYP